MEYSWDVYARYCDPETGLLDDHYVTSFTRYAEADEYVETLMRNDPNCYAWIA